VDDRVYGSILRKDLIKSGFISNVAVFKEEICVELRSSYLCDTVQYFVRAILKVIYYNNLSEVGCVVL
jgi:hypothetical protein